MLVVFVPLVALFWPELARKNDLLLQRRVIDEPEFEPQGQAPIGVSVRGGMVTLSGHVDFAEKFAAERTVRRVKALAQEVEVRLPSDRKTADEEIAARAVKILSWDAVVARDPITVKVERGIVTLRGEVDWQLQRAEAEYDVRKLASVKAISPSRVHPEDVHAMIGAALERHAEIEAGTIRGGAAIARPR